MAIRGGKKKLRGKEHDDICKIILCALRNDGFITGQQIREITKNGELRSEMVRDYNLLIPDPENKRLILNIEQVKRCCYVIPDEMWEGLADIEYVHRMKEQLDGRKRRYNPEQAKERRRQHVLERQKNRKEIVPDTDPLSTANILLGDLKN